jgi:DNA polymerase-3 subunit delta'
MSWSVVGHARAVASLQRSLREDRLAHAYLITGPEQVGKARLALDLAKAIECAEAERPCGACRSCRLVEAGRHPDVMVVSVGGVCDQADHDHARDGSKDIKICQIRRLERSLVLSPFEGPDRVVIIDPADALNVFASDALLKTLEEPPPHVEIILIARDAGALSETIVSRARRIALGPVPLADIRAELENRGVEGERAAVLAQLARGRIGWAIQHASDETLAEQRRQWFGEIERIGRARRAERMRLAAELAARYASKRDDLLAFLGLLESWWRDLLLASEGCHDLVANSDRSLGIRALAQVVPASAAVAALIAVGACRQQIHDNVNTRLALEVLVLRLPGPFKGEEVEQEQATLSR